MYHRVLPRIKIRRSGEILLLAAIVFVSPEDLYSQDPGSTDQVHELKLINEQVWEQFMASFRTLDPVPMTEIHSENLLRIPANSGTILDYPTYMDRVRKNCENALAQNRTLHIGLRFIERITDGTHASERGIYKLTINQDTEQEQSYYGQFHVILKKTEGRWKITMDYDSNEGGTIGEKEYMEAFALDDLERFNHE